MEQYISLFPLPVVLLPGALLPLHIYEERYKRLINTCLEQHRSFGVVLQQGDKIYSDGCTAEITHLLKRFPDGRMNIIARGRQRFQVIRFIVEKAYQDGVGILEGMVTYFSDNPASIEAVTPDLVENCLALYGDWTQLYLPGTRPTIKRSLNLEMLSFFIAAHGNLDLEIKQALLELRSTRARFSELQRLLKQKIKTAQMQQIISGNGHFA